MSDKVEFIALSEKYFQNLYFCQALDQRVKVVYVDFLRTLDKKENVKNKEGLGLGIWRLDYKIFLM